MSKNHKKPTRRRVVRALTFPFSADEYREFMELIPARAKFRYASVSPAPGLISIPDTTVREFFEARWWEVID